VRILEWAGIVQSV